MAIEADHDPLASFSDDELAEYYALLDDLDEPIEDEIPEEEEEEEKGWFICVLREPVVNGFKAVPELTTGFVNLLKTPYYHVYVERENTGGNFCGHDPKAPRFVMQNHPYFVPAEIDDLGDKRRPQILYDIVERVKAYYHDPDVMPVMQIANADKRISDRKRRSEARERIVNLLSIMVMYMDLGSLRVGQPTKDGGFFNYGIEWLARKAKLSLSRAERAMSDLNDSMMIASYQHRELIDKEKKEYIAYNAARVFDPAFFRMLEIDQQKLGKARSLANKKQKNKEAEHTSALSMKDQAVLDLNMKKIMKAIDPNDKALKCVNLAQNEEDKAKANRLAKKRTEVLLELMEYPELRNDAEALENALHQRIKELNLYNDQHKIP